MAIRPAPIGFNASRPVFGFAAHVLLPPKLPWRTTVA